MVSITAANMRNREDDTNWPKKNIVGKQELEIRIGNDHIALEVRLAVFIQGNPLSLCRLQKSGHWLKSKKVKIPKVYVYSIILSRT